MHPITLHLRVLTQRFALPGVRADGRVGFVDPRLFGRDFAGWLLAALAPLTADGFELSEPIQESYGWSIRIRQGRIPITVGIGLSFPSGSDESLRDSQVWFVFVEEELGQTPLRFLFSRRPLRPTQAVERQVNDVLRRERDFAVSTVN